MGWDDIDLVELNEAFAPAVLTGWGWDERDRLNVNGSGISLGHPIGATGGRILANLPRELKRRDGTYGLETMFIGGGQGIEAVVEADRSGRPEGVHWRMDGAWVGTLRFDRGDRGHEA